MFLSRKKMMI